MPETTSRHAPFRILSYQEVRSRIGGLDRDDALERVDGRFVIFEIVVDPTDAIERVGHGRVELRGFEIRLERLFVLLRVVTRFALLVVGVCCRGVGVGR